MVRGLFVIVFIIAALTYYDWYYGLPTLPEIAEVFEGWIAMLRARVAE